MIEIKDDKIVADGIERYINKINVITLSRNYLSFSGRIADCVKYEQDIDSFYKELINTGNKSFILFDNKIINLNNIDSMHIDFYQYAGISILKSSKTNADLYILILECNNGKNESIPFRTFKEAEHCCYFIDNALAKFKNEETTNKILNA